MKTKEELNNIKAEAEALTSMLKELSEDELIEIAGGEKRLADHGMERIIAKQTIASVSSMNKPISIGVSDNISTIKLNDSIDNDLSIK